MKQAAINDLYSRQNDLIVKRSEREARRISSIVVSAWDNLLAWIRHADYPTYQQAWKQSRAMVVNLFERLYKFGETALFDVAQWGWHSALDVFYESIGSEGIETLQEASEIRKPFRFPGIQTIQGIIHATVNGMSARGRLVSLFQTATIKHRLIDKIATLVSVGARLSDAKTAIQPILNSVKASAERLIRTEVRRVAHAMHGIVWEKSGQVIEGFSRRSQRDERVRPEHAAIDGSYYSYNEPRPSLPDAPNCRCYYVPVIRRTVLAI